MAKRRTRKQKENTKYTFNVSWDPDVKSTPSRNSVNRQKNLSSDSAGSKTSHVKQPNSSEQDVHTSEIRRDITKSLSLTTFILGLELVLYLFLN